MANRLKIYACSGLNDVTEKGAFNYWTDGTRTLDNTQAANTIIAKINLDLAQLEHLRTLTDEQKIWLIQEINVYTVCLYFVRQYESDPSMLQKAGFAIGAILKNVDWSNDYTDAKDAEEEANYLIACVQELLDNGVSFEKNDDFAAWWKYNVLDRNKVGFGEEKRKTIRKAMTKAVEGIGEVDPSWQDDPDLGKYLTKSSEYFLYCYFTEEQLSKLPVTFRRKKKTQIFTYNYCKDLFVGTYGSEQDMQDIIRAGIIGYFNATPEDVCKDIVSGKREAVGIPTAVIVAIVGGIFALVQAVILKLLDMAKETKVAEHQRIDQQALSQATPNEDDFDGLNFGGGKSSMSWVAIAAIGTGLLLLLRN